MDLISISLNKLNRSGDSKPLLYVYNSSQLIASYNSCFRVVSTSSLLFSYFYRAFLYFPIPKTVPCFPLSNTLVYKAQIPFLFFSMILSVRVIHTYMTVFVPVRSVDTLHKSAKISIVFPLRYVCFIFVVSRSGLVTPADLNTAIDWCFLRPRHFQHSIQIQLYSFQFLLQLVTQYSLFSSRRTERIYPSFVIWLLQNNHLARHWLAVSYNLVS